MSPINREQLIEALEAFYNDLKKYQLLREKEDEGYALGEYNEALRRKIMRKSGPLKPIVVQLTDKRFVTASGHKFDFWAEGLGKDLSPQRSIISLNWIIDAVNEAIGKLESEYIKEVEVSEMKVNLSAELERLRKLRKEADDSGSWRYDGLEFEAWKNRAMNLIRRVYSSGSAHEKDFGKATSWVWPGRSYLGDDPGYPERVQETFQKMLPTAKGFLDALISDIEARVGIQVEVGEMIPKEVVFPSDTPYDAYKVIREIIKGASNELMIADPYVDGSVVDLLENVEDGVDIRILTQQMQGDFKTVCKKFKEQREKSSKSGVEVRTNDDIHDRYVLVDDQVYQCGASIKDAGKKAFSIIRFEDDKMKKRAVQIVEDSWKHGKAIL